MIYNTAYQTRACHGFRIQKIIDGVAEARIRDYLPSVDGTTLVRSTKGSSAVIPAFNFPIYIGKQDPDHLRAVANYADGPFLAVDLRSCGTWNEEKHEFEIRNITLYKTKLYRAALTGVWLSQGPNAVRNITPMAMSVFASWISETVRGRYGLDPKTQFEIYVLAAIFYTSNHIDGFEFDKLEENRYLAGIANSLRVDLKEVIALYDQSKLISSVEEFCTKVRTITNCVRLEEFHAGILTDIMKATWYGENNAESVLVAMEHPPTWLSILLEAYTNTAMRKSTIFKIVERRQYKDGLDMLVRAVKALAPETAEMIAQDTRQFK